MSPQSRPLRYPLVRRPTSALLDDEEFARRCGLHPELVRRFWALGLIPAARHVDGSLWFSPAQVPAVARLQRLRASLPLNYAALGLVCDLLDRITDLETALSLRGRTEPVRRRAPTQQPTANPPERSQRWT
jgi:chaperone modulatory protein CbpM